jgi:hypothetical protein
MDLGARDIAARCATPVERMLVTWASAMGTACAGWDAARPRLGDGEYQLLARCIMLNESADGQEGSERVEMLRLSIDALIASVHPAPEQIARFRTLVLMALKIEPLQMQQALDTVGAAPPALVEAPDRAIDEGLCHDDDKSPSASEEEEEEDEEDGAPSPPSRKRARTGYRCGICNAKGHTRPTCPQRLEACSASSDSGSSYDESSGSESEGAQARTVANRRRGLAYCVHCVLVPPDFMSEMPDGYNNSAFGHTHSSRDCALIGVKRADIFRALKTILGGNVIHIENLRLIPFEESDNKITVAKKRANQYAGAWDQFFDRYGAATSAERAKQGRAFWAAVAPMRAPTERKHERLWEQPLCEPPPESDAALDANKHGDVTYKGVLLSDLHVGDRRLLLEERGYPVIALFGNQRATCAAITTYYARRMGARRPGEAGKVLRGAYRPKDEEVG